MQTQIRWLLRGDLPQILRIERQSFSRCWSEQDFLYYLRRRNVIGMVAETPTFEVVGYMIYELHEGRYVVTNFAVDKYCRRQGVGTQMIQRVIEKLPHKRREIIEMTVGEWNLEAQLMLHSMGFQCVGINHDQFWHLDKQADGYEFRYAVEEPSYVNILEQPE